MTPPTNAASSDPAATNGALPPPLPDTAPQRRLGLPLAALAFAVGTYFPYCALLALPAVGCGIISLWRRPQWWLLVLTIPLLGLRGCAALVSFPELPSMTPAALHRPYANAILANAHLPMLPATATRVRAYGGGFMAKHVYVAFDATEADAQQFCAGLGDAPQRSIPTECHFVTFAQASEERDHAMDSDTHYQAVQAQQVLLHGVSPGWYRLDLAKRGWYATNYVQKTFVRWECCYDADLGRCYMHWSLD